jgi:hypothetical protein
VRRAKQKKTVGETLVAMPAKQVAAIAKMAWFVERRRQELEGADEARDDTGRLREKTLEHALESGDDHLISLTFESKPEDILRRGDAGSSAMRASA